MTTCTPLKPFRCWQYRKDSGEAVPVWAKETTPPIDGWWLVEFVYAGTVKLNWYTPAEFAERFRVLPHD
jgi:hypothetical protein